MSRQYWVSSLPPMNVADGAAYANSTTLTDVSPAPGIVLPANFLEVGTRLRVKGYGRYSNTATPTLILGIYVGTGAIGSAAVTATAAITTPTTVTNNSMSLDAIFHVRTAGTTGTVHGLVEVAGVSSATGINLGPATAPTTMTVDTTVAQKVMVGATWGTANAANTLTWHFLELEALS